MSAIKVKSTLPDESQMDRDDLLEAFVAVLNICEPDHPYFDDPYPIDKSLVEHTWTTAYWAKCGPKRGWPHQVSYYSNKSYVNSLTTEKHLALLTHEVSHVTEGRHSGDKTHPKAFWREMAFNCWQVRENWVEVQNVFGSVDKETYIEKVVLDPNSSTVDRRMETVDERRATLANQLGYEYDPTTNNVSAINSPNG